MQGITDEAYREEFERCVELGYEEKKLEAGRYNTNQLHESRLGLEENLPVE